MRKKNMRKKIWATPLLTVLVKSKPGEAVLDLCKFIIFPAGENLGPNTAAHTCHRILECATCSGNSQENS